MPIKGERWGQINRFEKDVAGSREFDLRETTVLSAMNDAGNKMFEPSIEHSTDMYAVLLRRESDTPLPKGSKTPSLARYRCYVFSGPHSEIPFSLDVLGYPKNLSKNNLSLDHFTIEMFPIFTCIDQSVSKECAKKKEGTIVKVDYENKSSLSGPVITSVTSYPPLTPEKTKSTISQFLNGTPYASRAARSAASLRINNEKVQKQLRKESLSRTNGRPLGLLWPVPRSKPSAFPNSRYGPRIMKSGKEKKHAGIDIGGEKDDPVLASEGGKVIIAKKINKGRYSYYGKYIVIEHKRKNKIYYTLYAHLNDVGVRFGQEVKKGQQIGKVGSTGNSDAPHLHYEVQVDRQSRSNSVEPYVHFDNLPTRSDGSKVISD